MTTDNALTYDDIQNAKKEMATSVRLPYMDHCPRCNKKEVVSILAYFGKCIDCISGGKLEDNKDGN